MQLEELLSFIEDSSFLDQINSSDIPNINLYMDQVLTFMDEELEFYRRNPKDKLFTKSMINNYAKNNLIPKPENKKYMPQHIITLIYIFYMKQILSLDDIKSIIDLYSKDNFTSDKMFDLYDIFLKLEKSQMSEVNDDVKKLSEKIYSDSSGFDDNEKLFLFIPLLISRANIYKVMIEKLLDKNL